MMITLPSGSVVRRDLEFTKNVTMDFGAAKLRLKRLYISDLSGPLQDFLKVDGIIGYDLLQSAVVVLDYPKKQITIMKPASFSYKGRGESIPLSINSGGWASVEASLSMHGSQRSHSSFLIDTTLIQPLVAPIDMTQIQQVESIDIGTLKVNLDPGCCTSNIGPFSRDKISRINPGLLNFVATFDYPRARLILERPN
jgi:hypothetical protein